MHRAALTALILSLASPSGASDFRLAMPIDCSLGDTCHIQQFMDRDPGPGSRDFTCGSLSYDGHKGTDFALPTRAAMDRGVNVLAAAPGRVRGTRDGMPDQIMTSENAEQIAGRDCGNGVAITHADGYETQYCHMKNGSVRVREGDLVEAGDILGEVGLSGRTQFPHLHITLRRGGTPIDPFDPQMRETCGPAADTLWQDPAPAYQPGGLLDAGFAAAIPDYAAVQAGTAAQSELPTDAGAIVLFGFAFGAQAGDQMVLTATGPDGTLLSQTVTLDKTQAQLFRAVGKRRPQGLAPGTYRGAVELRRDGQPIDRHTVSMTVR